MNSDSVDLLIYLDPPFNSNANYMLRHLRCKDFGGFGFRNESGADAA